MKYNKDNILGVYFKASPHRYKIIAISNGYCDISNESTGAVYKRNTSVKDVVNFFNNGDWKVEDIMSQVEIY